MSDFMVSIIIVALSLAACWILTNETVKIQNASAELQNRA